jgi:hypothetical protein
MPSTKNLAAYSHIAKVFEAALETNGARIVLATPKAANAWRQSANFYRSLLRKLSLDGTCRFDHFVLRLDDCAVKIEPRDENLGGILTDLNGRPIVASKKLVPPQIPRSIDDRINMALGELKVDDD